MTVATPNQPNVTTQTAVQYKSAIDAQTAALAQTANMYAPHEVATPNMTVVVDAGRFLASAVTLVQNTQQTTAVIVAPVTNPRIDRVVIDATTGVVSIVAGIEAASPSAPAIPSGKLPICQVALTISTTAITNSMLTDERAFMANFPVQLDSANIWTAWQTMSHISPRLIFDETDAAADNQFWDVIIEGETLYLRVLNNAGSASSNILKVDRTDTTIDSVEIGGTTAIVTNNLTVGNTVNSVSGYKLNGTVLPIQKVSVTTPIALTSGAQTIFSHGLGVVPVLCNIYLVCQTAEGGYVAGDIVPAPTTTIESTVARGFAVKLSSTDVTVTVGGATSSIALLNLTTGAVFLATNANWKYIIQAYA